MMRATARAHPNVALVKYWGKRPGAGNLPATGSLSLTLGGLSTTTRVSFDPDLKADALRLNGAEDPATAARVTACLDVLRGLARVATRARVESDNDFPTGAGLASSASGFAALVTAAAAALDLRVPAQRLAEIARAGSGSAARSLLGGIVLLRNEGETTTCAQLAAPPDWPLSVIVAVTTEGPKAVGSRDGMERSQRTSPFYEGWVRSHPADLEAAIGAVRERDFDRLAEISEHNCLKMHSVMMTTRPPLLYWTPATLACLHRVRELRAEGVPVFFTIDAGPQVKAVCIPRAAATVAAALAAVPGVVRLIESPLGDGARILDRAD